MNNLVTVELTVGEKQLIHEALDMLRRFDLRMCNAIPHTETVEYSRVYNHHHKRLVDIEQLLEKLV